MEIWKSLWKNIYVSFARLNFLIMEGGKRCNRKLIRLKNYDYSWPGFYFVTICVNQRRCVLGEIREVDKFSEPKMFLSDLGRIAQEAWVAIPKYYENVELYEFAIMPNHLHGIIVINNYFNYTVPELNFKNNKSVETIHESSDAIRELHLQNRESSDAIRELHLQGNKSVETIHESSNKLNRRNMLLPKIIGKFKMNSAKEINQVINNSGNSFWQSNYYEHVIRSEKSLHKIQNYIIDNPRKWCEDPENLANKNGLSEASWAYNQLFKT